MTASDTGRVVLFQGHEHPLTIARYPVRVPSGSEILVRVACCTLCSSDLHTHAGRRHGPMPTVLGHEIVGRIAALGPDAPGSDLRGTPCSVGDRITWSVVASCGRCFFCADDLPQKCEQLVKYGHEQLNPAHPFAGGLADYVLLKPGTAFLRVPESIPDSLAAQANCATATVAAVLRAAGRLAGRTVLIFGAGVLGLTAAAMARSLGAHAVVVCERDPARRVRSTDFGATHSLPADPDELTRGVADITQGRGADVVIELAGAAATVQAALSAARVGGMIVLAGTVLPTPAVALDPEQVVRRMLTIRGMHNYTPGDLAAAVDFLAGDAQKYPFDRLVGPAFELSEVEAAFTHAHAHPGLRVAVVPGEPAA